MKSLELRVERVEKDMTECSVRLGARFNSLADSLRAVEQNVQDLLEHRCELDKTGSEMRTSLTELSNDMDKITEVYRVLPEIVPVVEQAKQTRRQLCHLFEQLDVLESRIKSWKANSEIRVRTLVNETRPSLSGLCERRTTNSITASLESILSHPLLGARRGSIPQYDFINSGVEKVLHKQPVFRASLRNPAGNNLRVSNLGLCSQKVFQS